MSVTVKKKRTFRLRTIFAAILVIVLLLPLSGGYFFRIYENELVRQTEAELISQGIDIGLFYKTTLLKQGPLPSQYGNPAIIIPPKEPTGKYTAVMPALDLWTETILPARPDGVPPLTSPTTREVKAGNVLVPLLKEAMLSTLSSVRILNPQGVVLAGTADMRLSLADNIEVQKALQGQYASVVRTRAIDSPLASVPSISRSNDIRVFIALPILYKGRVIGAVYLSRSPRNMLKALYEQRESVFIGGLFILCLTMLIALLLSHYIGKPLNALNRHALKLASGERETEQLPHQTIEELALLMQSFEKMSLTIEERSEYIRSFAMHLAHEFKTPLTAIQGAIELIRDHPNDMSTEQRLRFIGNITKDTDRLKKLVTRLLELARADVMQPGSEYADVVSLLHAVKEKYAPKIELLAVADTVSAKIGPDILETVLVNLIENSFQHGASKVELQLSTKEELIFTPFFTTRRENGGTGLGLVISKSLLKAHGGDLGIVQNVPGAHFVITLKAAISDI